MPEKQPDDQSKRDLDDLLEKIVAAQAERVRPSASPAAKSPASYDPAAWEVTTRLYACDEETNQTIELEFAAAKTSVTTELEQLSQLADPVRGGEGHGWRLSQETETMFFTMPDTAIRVFCQSFGDSGKAVEKLLRSEGRVPSFGSPPSGWTSITEALGATGPVAAAVMLAGDKPATLILAIAGLTIWIRVLDPTARAAGEALADWVRTRLRERMGLTELRERFGAAGEQKGQAS